MNSRITKEQAIILGESCWWKNATAVDIAGFQLFEDKLCTDFSTFHGALEEVLEHPVWTHQLTPEGIKPLQKEFREKYGVPTVEGIMRFVPKEKKKEFFKIKPLLDADETVL